MTDYSTEKMGNEFPFTTMRISTVFSRPPFGKLAWLPVVLLLLATGCHRDEVKVYRVAKDQDQPQPPSAPALPTDSPNPSLPPGHPDISSAPGASLPATPRAGLPQLTWQTPAGWTEVAPGEMRVASFKVPGAAGQQADVSVVPLPGLAGSDDANVNRWRGQVGQPPAAPDELKKRRKRSRPAASPHSFTTSPARIPGAATRNASWVSSSIARTWPGFSK